MIYTKDDIGWHIDGGFDLIRIRLKLSEMLLDLAEKITNGEDQLYIQECADEIRSGNPDWDIWREDATQCLQSNTERGLEWVWLNGGLLLQESI